ncbi:UDP-N-acetylmuramoyl-tripeptide--D-alanyl-D-alanine ligase [Roseisalinus antarcticus]|uniref:UDP-N-acetylmuramoyl-tripeptide--D-alanyl-D-alanine ligase n=1 Tax=Roseisalinus antarcticus TaxID=254357 RepID=A0A1Y5SUC6_9RHOB|nr:UDP-N-acetylmuramoyl-tripeptide--D-alanyl-D-alanine ligase [Roseisalinus antarcticus]SLN48535.1 UDP-N-acetylmuramoyl-tripeptide--D-alanyl-D-alanine ligase [Roseisalinus antarcticus]
MALWTAAEAASATGGRATTDWQAEGVSIDTRTIAPGDLFVALRAARDGHEFVAQALEKGAAAALVTHVPDGLSAEAPLLIVDDVQTALEDLGRAGRARTGARVAAITGSVGKTSTKEMLRAALGWQGKVHAAEASYNNHWGVPLTLARMPVDTDYAVIEIGMSHPGEIAPLARLARPHVAIVTTVAAAHLEAFGSIEGIAHEKAAIFDGLEPGGTAIYNADLDWTPILAEAARKATDRIISFGAEPAAHHRLLSVRVRHGATVGAARLWRTPVHLKVATEGRHFALNALAVLAASRALGADPARSLIALADWAPPSGRGTLERLMLDDGVAAGTIDLIDDAFNANPASMAAALSVLAGSHPRDDVGHIGKGRRIAILGDMLELGAAEAQLHAALARDPAMAAVQVVHCVGPRMQHLHRALPEARRGRWVETADALVHEAARLVDPGDVVLVKGSKGSKVSLLVDAIRKLGHRRDMSDQES